MRFRLIASLAAATAALAALAVPAFALTYQTNVTETNGSCTIARSSVSHRNTMILFHVINNGTIPHGIVVWGVRSPMAPPGEDANVYVHFRGPGTYPYACTAGTYSHPLVISRGVFVIRGSGAIVMLPAKGGGGAHSTSA